MYLTPSGVRSLHGKRQQAGCPFSVYEGRGYIQLQAHRVILSLSDKDKRRISTPTSINNFADRESCLRPVAQERQHATIVPPHCFRPQSRQQRDLRHSAVKIYLPVRATNEDKRR